MDQTNSASSADIDFEAGRRPGLGRTQTMIARDRRVIAELYLKGYPQYVIAEKVKLSDTTVSAVLAEVRDEWLQSSIMDFNAAKARELEHLDVLEREAWDAWELSKKPKVKKTHKDIGQGQFPGEEITKEVVRSDGNFHYLDIVQKCIAQRCQIIGITGSAIKLNNSGPVQINIVRTSSPVRDEGQVTEGVVVSGLKAGSGAQGEAHSQEIDYGPNKEIGEQDQ